MCSFGYTQLKRLSATKLGWCDSEWSFQRRTPCWLVVVILPIKSSSFLAKSCHLPDYWTIDVSITPFLRTSPMQTIQVLPYATIQELMTTCQRSLISWNNLLDDVKSLTPRMYWKKLTSHNELTKTSGWQEGQNSYVFRLDQSWPNWLGFYWWLWSSGKVGFRCRGVNWMYRGSSTAALRIRVLVFL